LHLLRLRSERTEHGGPKRLHISIRTDSIRYHERFFVASEKAAVAILPSANSPMNFDTALIVHDTRYVEGLLQHAKALYSKHRLESLEALTELEVLE